jgi:thiol:disulfide interchange protein DsbD
MRRNFFGFVVLALAVFAGMPTPAEAGLAPAAERNVEVRLVPETPSVAPGGTVTVALEQKIRDGWHTYWRNVGDAGAAPEIVWQLPEGWKAGPFQWPYPKRIPTGPLMNFGYEDDVTLLLDLTAPADAPVGERVTLAAKVTVYVCSDICIPEESELSIALDIAGATPAAGQGNDAALFAEAREALPRAAPWSAHYGVEGNRFALFVESPELSAARPVSVEFFPDADGFVQAAAPQKPDFRQDGVLLETAPGWKFTGAQNSAGAEVPGVLVLVGADGRTDAFALAAAPGAVPAPSAPDLSLAAALLFAFLGGMILNLMPCVLPVLSMKALALAATSRVPGAARVEALSYGAGVVAAFAALAALLLVLRAGGAAVGWGFQLQQPLFVAALALLMFAVGLNLSGLFEVSAGRLAGAGQGAAGRGGMSGSFFTGVLAAVVATPCTAPFMAAALGYGATQAAPVAFGVFIALAIGFAAPFVALGFIPGVLKRLPRPGPWMNTLKQALAFPMYGAAAWLAWVLSLQAGSSGLLALLAAALALAFAIWSIRAAREAQKPFGRRLGVAAAAVALIGGAAALAVGIETRSGQNQVAAASAEVLPYEPYSAARLAALRGENTPVFVNATAAWCITCLVNERVALSGDAVESAFAEKGVVALKADWTNQNPEITALLSEHGRSGVPLYLYFAPGAGAKVLPQILTEGTVLAAVQAGT